MNIEQITGCKLNSCDCEKCVALCHKQICLGTPTDIARIIEAGYADQVAPTIWAAGLQYGVQPVKMVQPIYDKQRKCCTFLTNDGKCSLHDKGLKPTEGRYASGHQESVEIKEGMIPLTWLIAAQWKTQVMGEDVAKTAENLIKEMQE